MLRPNLPAQHPHIGERRSLVNGAVIHFEECEFIDLCSALLLAETYHQNQLNAIRTRLAMYCSTTGTSGVVGSSD